MFLLTSLHIVLTWSCQVKVELVIIQYFPYIVSLIKNDNFLAQFWIFIILILFLNIMKLFYLIFSLLNLNHLDIFVTYNKVIKENIQN